MSRNKIPILLLTNDRPNMLEKVLKRVIRYTDWNQFDLWILDNFSTKANSKIISMFKANYPFINVHSTTYNQVSVIQNEVIRKLKSDIYIKMDDDMLVSENWTTPLIDVYNRNYQKMSFGSVVIPINGFGWIPFLEIMNFKNEFVKLFPDVELKQECMDVAVWYNREVNDYIWEKCIDIDATARTFIENQNGNFRDLICPHRYSIGTIVFSHKTWEDMGGWRIQSGYDKVLRKQKRYNKIANWLKGLKDKKWKDKYTRANLIADIMAGATSSEVGGDELGIYEYSRQKGLIMPITTQGIAFHFSFGPFDQHLMNKFYLRLN
jgi:hypothetical protein